MTENTVTDLETELRGLAAPSEDALARVSAAFAARAAADGLVDVAFESHDTPYGPLLVAATGDGLVRVALPVEGEAGVLEGLARRVSVRVLRAPRQPIRRARQQLDEYFAGRRREFDLPLDWRLTAGFRQDVLRATARIPYGNTRSYKQVAELAGRPAAVRAAGTALATNPLPIVVPCHRVLRTGGALGGYLGGLEMKQGLLDLEQAS